MKLRLTLNRDFPVPEKILKKFTRKNLYSSTFAYNTKNHRHICEMDQDFIKKQKKSKLYF